MNFMIWTEATTLPPTGVAVLVCWKGKPDVCPGCCNGRWYHTDYSAVYDPPPTHWMPEPEAIGDTDNIEPHVAKAFQAAYEAVATLQDQTNVIGLGAGSESGILDALCAITQRAQETTDWLIERT